MVFCSDGGHYGCHAFPNPQPPIAVKPSRTQSNRVAPFWTWSKIATSSPARPHFGNQGFHYSPFTILSGQTWSNLVKAKTRFGRQTTRHVQNLANDQEITQQLLDKLDVLIL
jgi:hypothetical protein